MCEAQQDADSTATSLLKPVQPGHVIQEHPEASRVAWLVGESDQAKLREKANKVFQA